MVTVDLIETWIHKGVFDRPHTGEDPPFQFLHLPVRNLGRSPANRPHDDAEEDYSSENDDETDHSSSNLSDDMPSSNTSKRSYVSAGDPTHETFVKQLKKNGVLSYGTPVLLASFGLEDMESQKLRDMGGKLPAFDILTKLIDKMYNTLQWRGPTDEARFQARVEPVLTRVINSQTIEEDPERYHITSSVNWNRAPLVFYNNNWRDLSQPKVDVCFCIASKQSRKLEGTPLHDIGKEVDPNRASEIAELLSRSTLTGFLADPDLAEVCFVPFAKTPDWALYPISIFEIKATTGDLPIARNQVVNAAVFQCGKHIDLILQAQKCAEECRTDFIYNERVTCLGMSIAGTVWQIDVVSLSQDFPLDNPKFVYEKVIGGDWKDDAESFLGAVITMHRFMLHRVVKLLVAAYPIFKAYQAQNKIRVIPLNFSQLPLPARTLPIPEKKPKKALESVSEEPGAAQALAKTMEAVLSIKEEAQATPKQTSEQA